MLMCTGQAMAYDDWTQPSNSGYFTSTTWTVNAKAGQYIVFDYEVSSCSEDDYFQIIYENGKYGYYCTSNIKMNRDIKNTYVFKCDNDVREFYISGYSRYYGGSLSVKNVRVVNTAVDNYHLYGNHFNIDGIQLNKISFEGDWNLYDGGLKVDTYYNSYYIEFDFDVTVPYKVLVGFFDCGDLDYPYQGIMKLDGEDISNGNNYYLSKGSHKLRFETSSSEYNEYRISDLYFYDESTNSIDTIVVNRAGTLGGEALKIRKNLKDFSRICVKGPFDEYDWKTIDEMGLDYLDITDVEVKEYPDKISRAKEVKLSKFVTEIKHNPFPEVVYMYVPKEVTKISAEKFDSYYGFAIEGCEGVTNIPAHIFENTKISSASFPSLTEVPEYAFHDSKISTINLPNVTKVGNNAFDASPTYYYSSSSPLLVSVSAPNLKDVGAKAFYGQRYMQNIETFNLKNIGEYAFNDCQELRNVDLSEAKNVPNYAFYNCNKLTVPSMESLESIGKYAFYNCYGLKEAIIPNVTNVSEYAFFYCYGLTALDARRATNIGKYAFDDCYNLKTANLSKAETISDNAFKYCSSLQEINLPEVSSLGAQAFYNCSAATSINMSDKLTQIGDQSFYGCTAAEQITLPASLMHLPSQCFSGSTNIKVINCNAPAPPTVGDVPFYMQTVYTATLRVPESSLKLYQSDFYWKHFYYMETNPDEVTDLTIRTEIPYGENRFDKINLTIAVGGALEMSGTKSQAFRSVTFEADKNGAGALLSNTQRISSDATKMALNMEGLKWYFFTLPFDAQITDIDNTNDAQLAIYSYDGAHRAQYGTGGNWTRHTSGTLSANKGYIVQASKATEITFKATYETRNSAFLQGDKSIALDANTSSTASNKGWNYIGNPYSTYYDISYMDFSAPITVWNGSTYQAYSVEDDEFALRPMQSFFVQCPNNVTAIAFDKDGRQTNGTVQRAAAAKTMSMMSMNSVRSQRKVIDIVLSDNSNSDRTRIVVNEEATDDYDMERDAAKMMSMDETVPQLYTERDGEQYAINEGPQSAGTVDLGLYIPAAGKYTIKATRSDINAYIVDAQTGKRVLLAEGYTFEAEQGMMTERMSIELAADEDVTGVATETADDAEAQDIYDLSGKKLDGKKAGINIIRRGENVKKSVVR